MIEHNGSEKSREKEKTGETYINMAQLCDMLHISRGTAHKLMKEGEITGYRIHKEKWLFKRQEVVEYVEAQRFHKSEERQV